MRTRIPGPAYGTGCPRCLSLCVHQNLQRPRVQRTCEKHHGTCKRSVRTFQIRHQAENGVQRQLICSKTEHVKRGSVHSSRHQDHAHIPATRARQFGKTCQVNAPTFMRDRSGRRRTLSMGDERLDSLDNSIPYAYGKFMLTRQQTIA